MNRGSHLIFSIEELKTEAEKLHAEKSLSYHVTRHNFMSVWVSDTQDLASSASSARLWGLERSRRIQLARSLHNPKTGFLFPASLTGPFLSLVLIGLVTNDTWEPRGPWRIRIRRIVFGCSKSVGLGWRYGELVSRMSECVWATLAFRGEAERPHDRGIFSGLTHVLA